MMIDVYDAGSGLATNLCGWWLGLPEISGGGTLYNLLNVGHATLTSAFLNNWGTDRNGFSTVRTTTVSAGLHRLSTSLVSNGTFTLSGWFRALGFGTGQFGFNVPFSFTGSGYSLVAINTGRSIMIWGSGSGEPVGASVGTWPNDSNWHHFVLTRTGNSGSYIAYIDGSSTGSVSSGSSFSTSATLNLLGRSDTSQSWDGYGSDIRYYSGRALSATEVRTLYFEGLTNYQTLNRHMLWILQGATTSAPFQENPALRMLAMKLI